MAYRRTERVIARLAARQEAIVAAARALASESGMGAVQIVPVAERAGIAAGTVYRYFPSKDDLVAALSALAAAIKAFAVRALAERRLAFAMLAGVAEADAAAERLAFRHRLAAEFATHIRAAIAAGHLPEQDPAIAAAAVIGAVMEGLVGPLSGTPESAEAQHSAAQALTLFALRALGVVDARARGLVVQAG
jgi:AcrR family transcriptional regulator